MPRLREKCQRRLSHCSKVHSAELPLGLDALYFARTPNTCPVEQGWANKKNINLTNRDVEMLVI
jgi:hypothetical protein